MVGGQLIEIELTRDLDMKFRAHVGLRWEPLRTKSWSLTSLQQRLVKTGGRFVKHAAKSLLLPEAHVRAADARRLTINGSPNIS
jgi:hypothetical protein